MEKDFLQSLKLEISKSFTLSPYERIAFHKILGLQKSESGRKILLRDLKRDGILRASAIFVLKHFDEPEVADAFYELFQATDDLSDEEFFNILDHIETHSDEKYVPGIIEYISRFIGKTDYIDQICKAAFTLGQISGKSSEAAAYTEKIIADVEMFEKLRCSAIESIQSLEDVSLLESVLKENNDRLNYAVYRALAGIADREMIKYEVNVSDDLFTVMPGQEDRLLLDIRVLLGKMSPMFDGYSRETKAAYIMAMIMCGHREFIVYTMKALTSNDPLLIDLTLYVILSYAEKLRTPDKLFRSLVSLPSVTSRDSQIIVDIFVKFFSTMRETKSNLLFKDKIFNYLIVTLDSYFETYRKSFMIPEIMEKDYSPQIQGVRRFIINRFSPEIKRKILSYLINEDFSLEKKILGEVSESVSYIPESEKSYFSDFIEMLHEKDQKVREIAASRIQDLDYEKRYLRNRIVRLCKIIERLKITEASSNLVKIFNYVKKYTDEEIYSVATYTLSLLNYPYMLSELEVLLQSGDETEQMKAVKLLALFSEQRSLNIMLDYLNEHTSEMTTIIQEIMAIAVRRDVVNNMAARETAKKIISENNSSEIRRAAVHLVGRCGYEEDIAYLIDLFQSLSDNTVKEAVVQSFDFIIQQNKDFNKSVIVNHLKEFLKDPGIKVRICACAILLRLGNQDALGTLRDMMVIKNRNIQREIIMVLGNFITADLGFFYVSLLREDYGISQDLLPLFNYLQPAEIKEIDHFVVNLFKKYEGAGFDFSPSAASRNASSEEMKNFKRDTVAIFILEIVDFNNLFTSYSSAEMTMVFKKIYAKLIDIIITKNGSLTRTAAGRIIAYFPEVVSATQSAAEIEKAIQAFNIWLLPEQQVRVVIFSMLSSIDIVNGEIVMPVMRDFSVLRGASLENKVLMSGSVARIAERSFKCETLPAALFRMNGTSLEFRELISPNNFMMVAENILDQLKDADSKKLEMQRQLEQGIKSAGSEKQSKNTLAFANAMERIGKVLRKDLTDVSKYVAKRSTDKELIRNVDKLVNDAYRQYMLEVSKTIIE